MFNRSRVTRCLRKDNKEEIKTSFRNGQTVDTLPNLQVLDEEWADLVRSKTTELWGDDKLLYLLKLAELHN